MTSATRSLARALVASGLGWLALILAPSAQAATVTYGYDSLGRLVSASYPDGSCATYSYDAAGNRTQYVVAAASPPVANTVNQSTYADVAATFDPRIADPSCVAFTITGVGAPGHGVASVVAGGGAVTYTPAALYVGADSFSYTISNGTQNATGTIAMTVNAPTLAPVALNGSGRFLARIPPPLSVTPSIFKDVSTLISDPYGYPLTISQVTQGASGAVTFSGTGVTYAYPGPVSTNVSQADSFTYTVSDGHGRTATATINVTVNVITNQ